MGAVGGLLGTAGGASGTGFAAPSSANILNPTTVDQANAAYSGVQGAQNSQQSLLQALQQQNGLANQNQVYGQLQGVVNGTGPNPAQAMLNQATGQNVANQAALAAGQRGANANVGLLSRQAAQQGANLQQQAVGQAATNQANQSLNALNTAGTMANTQAGNQIAQTNQNTASQQAEQSNLLNAIAQQNNANVGMQSNINTANAGLAQTTMGNQSNVLGGVGNALGATGMLGSGIQAAAIGANGGDTSTMPVLGVQNGAQSSIGRMLSRNAMACGGMTHDYRSGGPVQAASVAQKAVAQGNSYSNDKIPAVLSEHEIVIPRSITMGKNPVAESAKFVAQQLQKRTKK